MSSQIIGAGFDNNEIIITDALGNPMPKINRDEQIPIEERGKQLPTPSGYRILCAIPEAEEKHDGSALLKADETRRNEFVFRVFQPVGITNGPLGYGIRSIVA